LERVGMVIKAQNDEDEMEGKKERRNERRKRVGR
jgi:hypothetical protein